MNSMESVTAFFGWCTVINFGLLILAGVMLMSMRQTIMGIHARIFGVAPEALNAMYLRYLAYFKIGAIVFSFTPWLALKIMS